MPLDGTRRRLDCLILLTFACLLFGGCGPVRDTRHETWYSSPTWSPDDKQLAYVKSDVVYTRTSPRISLFVGEDSVTEENNSLAIFICVNDRTSQAESCLTQIKLSASGQQGTAVRLEWKDDGLYYGVNLPDGTSAGLWRISPENGTVEVVDPGGGVRSARPRRLSDDRLELYAGNEGYGFFGNQTIFLFDHARQEARVFLHDPLSDLLPSVPPYSITGQ